MKKLFVVMLVLCMATVAFAQSMSDWAESFNQKGHLNAYVSAGLWVGGIDVTGAVEYIAGEFDIAGIPFDWGVEARALVGFDVFYGFNDMYWAAGPLATLHMGLKWGLDVYTAVGLGLYGGSYWLNPVNFGFASFGGVSYKLSKNLFLLLEGGYIGNNGVSGLGVVIKL